MPRSDAHDLNSPPSDCFYADPLVEATAPARMRQAVCGYESGEKSDGISQWP